MRYKLDYLPIQRIDIVGNLQRIKFDLASADIKFAIVVGIFVAFAILFSIVIPLFEAPDEIWHFRYIKHLADTGRLPQLSPSNPGPWRQEGSQPPLYYALIASIISPIDTSDIDTVSRPNPHAAVGRAGADGNVNFIIHSQNERMPWRGAVLAVHLARFVSVFLGAITVALTYILALEIFDRTEMRASHKYAFGAAALVGLNPQFLFISGVINNDNLIITLATLTLVLLVRLINHGITDRGLAILGIVLGLAALSKLSGLLLWGLTWLVLHTYSFRLRHESILSIVRHSLRWYLIVFGVALAISGWWYGRNWLLYGDPTALNVHLQVFGHRAGYVSSFQLLREFEGLRWSFWAVFGWFNVLPPVWIHYFFDLLCFTGLIGATVYAVKQFQFRNWALLGRLTVIVCWLSLTLIALGRWTMMTAATQGRLLFPAISVVGILLIIGLTTLTPKRYCANMLATLVFLMIGMASYMAFGVIRPAYSAPRALSARDIDAIPHASDDVIFGDEVMLVGYDVKPDIIRPGDNLSVSLYWKRHKPIRQNYSLFIHLIGENDVILAQRDSYPGHGASPTSSWAYEEVIEDIYRVSVPTTLNAPQSTWVAVGLYDLEKQHRLALPDGSTRFALKSVQTVPAESDAGIPNPINFDLGGKLKLVGYQLSVQAAQPGETIDLILYWQAGAEMDRNYSVFTQLLNDRNDIWAQDDGQPLNGDYPTSRWAQGEIVRDPYRLQINSEAPTGVHRLEVGMYFLGTGERLYRTDNPALSSIRLADIRVLPKN